MLFVMVLGYSAEQVRAAEAPLLAAGEPLMRRAAGGLAEELRRVLNTRHRRVDGAVQRRLLLLVGPGNNGGDTMFAGAELAAGGTSVSIVPTGSRMHEESLAAALRAGARLKADADADMVSRLASGADIVVDGILGTGTSAENPALRGRARELVAAILPVLDHPIRPDVVAVDLPSGIDPDDGSVPDPVVLPADLTVTFGAVKAGLLLEPARRLAGEVRVIDIGLGPHLERVEPLVRTRDHGP
ncbi:NAD(P)H-hydrate epimerase [Lysobacter korlensis]|uniref:NAD(P)H-hydrate epimerase n=1 Tax=Lysobacter korlensis TaxID=553636 RepID=A0ABV6RNC4_9GAMM